MFTSNKLSFLILRLSLAIVFLWFGINKFVHPDYWINTWLPSWFMNFLTKFNLEALSFIYLLGVFEIAVGLSFLLNIFIKLFAFFAILFLLLIIITNNLNEMLVRDIGILGGVFALFFWKERK